MRIATIVLLLALHPAVADVHPYSPVIDQNWPGIVYWGDTHVHTSFSTGDANLNGGNTVPPAIAYRFARGEQVTAVNGEPVRLRRPLDFLVIADHAENLGIAFDLQTRHQALRYAHGGSDLFDRYEAYLQDRTSGLDLRGKSLGEDYERSVWQRVVARADAYNDPGKFTTFAGYEWSSPGTIPGVFGNLHRVVIFKDGASRTSTIVPFGADDGNLPEQLWRFLAEYEAESGGQVIAIPHNANLSNGQMFGLAREDGRPMDQGYAALRARFEPLMEVTQFKGDSESHPLLSPDDEFADFETWSSWGGRSFTPAEHPCCRNLPKGDELARRQGDYARSALKRGLSLTNDLGLNPFKVGMIGSTDTHSSLSTADSDNYWGKYSSDYPKPSRMFDQRSPGWPTPFWNMSPAGYAGVWARANTREAIFSALKRREVYATTGPRIIVRVFAGWGFTAADADRPDLAAAGYTGGVPMGGDLTAAPTGGVPRLLIKAVKDPDGANLDRVQVIKGWLDSTGQTHEQVFNVLASDGRAVLGDGSIAPVGSTVNLSTATYTNAIGATELRGVWQDPDFDPAQRAFYYLRVLEIPTPRWTAYDALRFGLKDIPPKVPMVSQERAYSSPIWYSPKTGS